jgi:ketosteroid isomerase-like protein
LRKAVARRYAQLEFEACNRQDWDVAFALYHPAAETIWDPSMVAVGFDSLTRGRDERISAQKRWAAEWGEFRFEPEELLDLRDGRFLVVGQVTGTGLSSGAASANAWAVLLTLSAGLAVREQVFLDRREALQAVGLAE